MSEQNEALELWKRWFEFYGSCIERNNRRWLDNCFFCKEYEQVDVGGEIHIHHADDCVYIAAKKLLGIE